MAGPQVLFCLLVCATAVLVADGTLSPLDLALLPQRPDGLTTRGTEFFFAFMGNDMEQLPDDQDAVIIVTTEEPNPVFVTAEVNEGFYTNNPNLDATLFPRIQTGTVEPGGSITFNFSVAPIVNNIRPAQDIRVYDISDTHDRSSGIRIFTDGGEVSVYGINNEISSVDAFSVFPCYRYPAIVGDYEYVILSITQRDNRDSRLMIVGCEDNTAVTVTPSRQLNSIPPTVPPPLGGGQTPMPDEPLEITLGRLTSILLNNREDLSGTRISSDKPIAVFTGHECGDVPTDNIGTCDHMVQQVPPQVTWGRLFFIVPIPGRYSGDHYRVATLTANTEFTLTCRTLADTTPNVTTIPIVFNNEIGTGFAAFNTTPGTPTNTRDPDVRKRNLQWCCIESNNPILVMQYEFGGEADRGIKNADAATFGDPLMTIIPPVVQYLNNYTVPTDKGLRASALNVSYTIAIPQDDTFFRSPAQDGSRIVIDERPIVPDQDEGWIEIYCANGQVCGYSARVESAPNGTITMRHINPSAAFSAWIYGIAGAVSFGFNAGFKLDEVGQPLVCIDNVTVNETLGVAMVTITRTGNVESGGSRFFLTVVDGTAISPDDYSVDYTVSEADGIFLQVNDTTRELRMSAGITELILTFNITRDDGPENPEDFLLFLEGARRVFIACPVGSVTIVDILPPPVEIGFDPVSYTVNEADRSVTLVIVKRGITTETVSVEFTTLPGTALVGDDYLTRTQTLTFLPNQFITTVQVQIVDDNTAEPIENFFGDLSNPVGRVDIFEPGAIVDIIDNDTPVSIGFTSPDYTVREDNGTVTVCLSKDVDTLEDLTLNVTSRDCDPPEALANQDYTPATNAVIFPATASIVCTSFGIIDDDVQEDPERFCVDFEVQPLMFDVPVEKVVAVSTVTIIDDEPTGEIPELPQKPDDAQPVSNVSGATVQIGCDVCIRVPPDDPSVVLNCTPINGSTPFMYNWFRTDDTNVVDLNIMTALLDVTEQGNYTCEVSNTVGTVTANSIVTFTPFGVFDSTIIHEGQEVDGNGCGRVPNGDPGDSSTLCAAVGDTITLVCTTSTGQTDARVFIMGTLSGEGNGSVSRTVNIDRATELGRHHCGFMHPLCGLQGSNLDFNITSLGGMIDFEVPDYTVIENNGTVTVCLSATDTLTENITLVVTASMKPTGNPASDSDYVQGNQTITFQAGTTRVCTSIEIIDDTIALEENEQFLVEFVDPNSALRRSSCVTIIDDDVVAVSFIRTMWPVPENNGTVFVCVNISNGIARELPIIVVASEKVADNAATENEDFLPESRQITFPASLVGGEECTSFVIFADNIIEGDETFNLDIISPDEAMEAPFPQAWVIIHDTTTPPPPPGCVVSDPLMVSPFVISENYNFVGTCEHTLVTSCTNTVDFAVTVDFLATNLANGRIGVRYMNRRFIYQEDGTVDTGSEDPIGQVGDTREYVGQVFITQNAGGTIMDFQSVGVQVIIANNQFQVNVADSNTLGETCGLCGNQNGTLLFNDRTTVANIMNMTQVRAFANSWLVPARDQFLRGIRRECAQLTNDTVIGDPLFTVPFTKGGDALCYEVHGSPDQHYNLVSDVCTNVNAYYNDAIAMDTYGTFEANFIQVIGVRAVGSSGDCYNIRVFEDVNGSCSAMTMGAADVFPPGMSAFDGITVRRTLSRVRISVPNCENVNLVMWVTCEERSGVRSLRLDISRGLNLRPTSHGLIGQFWNINITTEPFTGTVDPDYADADLRIVTVFPADGPPRRFLAGLNSIAWDKSRRPCYYAGNSQGGPWGIGPNFPVIQGRYTDYQVDGLFEDDFVYAQFEDERCN